jgi:hypothetical protein
MVSLRREMSVNHNAVLAPVKSKGEFSGIVERAISQPAFTPDTNEIVLSIRLGDGSIAIAKASEGTAFYGELDKKACNERLFNSTKLATKLVNARITVKATVKGQAAVGGKVYLTRASLVNVEAREAVL